MGQVSYQTNMASEFYVLSALARLGFDTSFSLEHNRKVDIVVIRPDGSTFTLDVKGIAGKNDWVLGDSELSKQINHSFVLLTFNGKIEDLSSVPLTWIIPSNKIGSYVKTDANLTKKCIYHKTIKEKALEYQNAWNLLGSVNL